MKTGHLKKSTFGNINRFDATYHLSNGVVAKRMISASPYQILTLGEVSEDVFMGNRSKRVYVKNPKNGLPFFSSSDILRADLENVKLASKKYTPSIDTQIIQPGWTLISRSGTVGNCAYATRKHAQKLASEDVIRLKPNNILKEGLIYAYLASKFGYSLLTQGVFGAVIQHVEPSFIKSLPIPQFPENFQHQVDYLIQSSARLREKALDMLVEADLLLKEATGLPNLTPDDYDYFGPRVYPRKPSCFIVKRKDITSTTINAFNHSERIRKTKASIKIETRPLKELLLGQDTFSSASVSSTEVAPENGILFINQKDIFDNIIKGKYVSKKNIQTDKLVKYSEIIVACDGTLGENELFCRTLFAYEELDGALISTHFIRMLSNGIVPSGYLYTWLNSDYGFRFIRNTQAGTKLCHPIPKLFLEIPVPIVDSFIMSKIDQLVREAHTKRYEANCKERKAISMVEEEIEKWNK